MGHSQPSVTVNVYGHVVKGAKKAAIDRIAQVLAEAQARCVAGEKRLS
jgi:hypothetical protein